jgi:hypothetical protein
MDLIQISNMTSSKTVTARRTVRLLLLDEQLGLHKVSVRIAI